MENRESICEEQIFRRLYDQFSDDIRNFVLYKSGDSGFAEDSVQESFLRLWKKCKDVPIEKARSFLYTVANNLFLDHKKHEKVQIRFLSHKPKVSTNESPAFLLEEKEFRMKIESAINRLPEQQRVVFLMNRIDKLKYREIAEALGISQKAVEKRMHKALLIIRKEIGNI